MEYGQLALWALGATGTAMGSYFGWLKYRDKDKINALAVRVATLEAEVVKCHTDKEKVEDSFREIRIFHDDKVIRLERERDLAISDLRIAQNRCIELQDRVEELRRR